MKLSAIVLAILSQFLWKLKVEYIMSKPENYTNCKDIVDVQNKHDSRNIPIQKVGVKSVRYPILINTNTGPQASIGNFNMYVQLPADKKGTHMSRFIELLEKFNTPFDTETIEVFVKDMCQRLEAKSGEVSFSASMFIVKKAPVSGLQSLLDIKVDLTAKMMPNNEVETFVTVFVPVTSLCPCSKAISEYGAHNQRSEITIKAQTTGILPIEDLVSIAESEASCEVYGLLKRNDEKFVTEKAYENPKFVEDIVRDIASKLQQEKRIAAFTVCSENFESIHNHSAFASIDSADLN